MNMLPHLVKKDFVVTIKLRILPWGDYAGLSGWAQCIITRVFIRERGRVREGVVMREAEMRGRRERAGRVRVEDALLLALKSRS